MSILDDELDARYPRRVGDDTTTLHVTRGELNRLLRAAYTAGACRKRTDKELAAAADHESGLGVGRGLMTAALARMDRDAHPHRERLAVRRAARMRHGRGARARRHGDTPHRRRRTTGTPRIGRMALSNAMDGMKRAMAEGNPTPPDDGPAEPFHAIPAPAASITPPSRRRFVMLI